ncbi:MAG: BMP family ABC transporter substrate-binding protein [Eubacteriales bacterium]
MKRIITMIIIMALAMLTVSCGTSTEDDTIKIGMVTDAGGVDDGAFNQSAWAGLTLASEELEVEVNYLESQTEADYATNIETFIEEDCELIITVGYMLAEATYNAAVAYPDQLFANIDDSTCAELDNVLCLMFESAESSYLAGYVAGLETESDVVGFVLGMESTMMNEFGYGYVSGVLDANSNATVIMANANSFTDSAIGKSLASAMVAEGADIIYHAAGAVGLGVIEVAQESGIKAIGVDTDQSSLAEGTVITSALKRVDIATYEVSKMVLEGTFESGLQVFDLASEGVGIVEDETLISAETFAVISDLKDAIASGNWNVPKTKEEFEAIYGEDVYTLD